MAPVNSILLRAGNDFVKKTVTSDSWITFSCSVLLHPVMEPPLPVLEAPANHGAPLQSSKGALQRVTRLSGGGSNVCKELSEDTE